MPKKASLPELDWCVAATLAWFSTLGRPLRLHELERLLLKRRATQPEIEKAIHDLSSKVTVKDGWYSLTGQEVHYPSSDSEKFMNYKWWRVRLAVGIIRCIPYVRLIEVANTLADRSASKDSDIDVFIVIQEGRLFLTRLLITGALQVAGLRRHGNKISNRICLSFFATDAALDLSPIIFPPYDIYLAYWIAELIPVLDDGGVDTALRQENAWVTQFVPTYTEVTARPVKPAWSARLSKRILDTPFGGGIERTLSNWQLKRIRARPANPDPDVKIIATPHMLKFHEKERRRKYREAWEVALQDAGFDPGRLLK